MASTSNGILFAKGNNQLGSFEEYAFLNSAFSSVDSMTGQAVITPSILFITRFDQPVGLPADWRIPILDFGNAPRFAVSQNVFHLAVTSSDILFFKTDRHSIPYVIVRNQSQAR